MRNLRDIHGLFNGRHFDREVVSSGRRYAERLSQQGGWARALSPLFACRPLRQHIGPLNLESRR